MPASAEEMEALFARVDRNMVSVSAEYFVKVVNEVPNKEPEEFILYLVYQDNKWAALITSPESLKGRAALRLGNQVWYHIPGELAPRSSDPSHSLLNGVLDYRILMRVGDLSYYRPELLQNDGQRVAAKLIPRNPADGLPERFVIIDQRLGIPQSETVFSPSKDPLKEITFQDVQQFGSLPPRPAQVIVKSLINKGYSTTMTIGWVNTREIPAEAFTLSFLPRIGTLLMTSQR